MGVQFMPTGGITTANVAEYLAVKEIVAVGGTWLGKSSDLAAGNFDAIRETVKSAVTLKNSL
jgi:2-dehydro-3-deoxyphosphogluconate aldolase/(4S)-4-hydroxy-2-oxoglutarate aldolase